MILGTEAYYQNDVDDRVVVHGKKKQPLEAEMVCFDIETTGLDRRHGVHHRNWRRGVEGRPDHRQLFCLPEPGQAHSREIVELTGITDDMVSDAPGQEEGLNLFLDWVGGPASGRP